MIVFAHEFRSNCIGSCGARGTGTRPRRGHGFEYYRHGTLSLYSALNTQTGEVLAKTSARHTSAQFVDFLAQPTLVSKNHVYVGSRSRRRRPKSSSARGIRKNVSPQDLYGIEPAQSKIPEGASITVSMYLHSVSN